MGHTTMQKLDPNRIHVVVGVITNHQNQVLISKRHDHLHQGGLWEFPGGKVEVGESPIAALQRELHEELNIKTLESHPLITIPHGYADKQVYLDVFKVTAYSGEAVSNEDQDILWADIADLSKYAFPAANKAIISALQLPDRYLITGKFDTLEQCQDKIQSAVAQSFGLIQLRQKELSDPDYLELATSLTQITHASNTKLILNSSLALFLKTEAAGLHFTGQRLRDCQQRPVSKDKLFSVSTHTFAELKHAVEIDADFAMLSPVLPTQSHPGEPALGWEKFSEIVKQIPIPVYALGGMSVDHIGQAQQHGAQGIAAISALWNAL